MIPPGEQFRIITGDCLAALATMPTASVNCCVTSPPYYKLRDYGHADQIGLEDTPDAYVARLVAVFREARRCLRDDGTLWLNLGDSYGSGSGGGQSAKSTLRGNGHGGAKGLSPYLQELNGKLLARRGQGGLKPKDLIGIPWRVAFALQADGWYLRQDIIWHKPNPMPESVTDRCTKSHEYIFMLSKSVRYYYDQDAIKEPATQSSIARLSQDIAKQAGSARVPGKTNGPMKAVGCGTKIDKQRGHSRRHDGFNDRWDAMEKAEQCSGMRNKRSVWTVATQPCKEAHFATYPPALIQPCILAGCPPGGTVLDMFAGTGTTGAVALEHSRRAILIELNPDYAAIAEARCAAVPPRLF